LGEIRDHTISEQTFSSNAGFAREVDVGMEYKVVSAETTIRNAMMFGNSQVVSRQSGSKQEEGLTFSSTPRKL